MRLGELHDELCKVPDDWAVWKREGDNDSTPCGGLISWRGVYAEASLDDDHDVPITVGELKEQVAEALAGKPLRGYKGGDYVMNAATPVHADAYGRWDGYIILRARDDVGARLTLVTLRIPDEYR